MTGIVRQDNKHQARVFYFWKSEGLREIHFVLTKDLEAHATVCYVDHCSVYSIDHYHYYVITGSQIGVHFQRCHTFQLCTIELALCQLIEFSSYLTEDRLAVIETEVSCDCRATA